MQGSDRSQTYRWFGHSRVTRAPLDELKGGPRGSKLAWRQENRKRCGCWYEVNKGTDGSEAVNGSLRLVRVLSAVHKCD